MQVSPSNMQPTMLMRYSLIQPHTPHVKQRPMALRCKAQQNEHPASCIRQVQQKQRRPLSAAVAAVVLVLHSAAAQDASAAASGDAVSDAATALGKFEPQFNPGLLVVALIAAAPPILFWGRIFLSAQRRQRQIDQEKLDEDRRQKERDELKRKLWGGK